MYKMKRAINQLIEKELKGVDIYSHNGSMWFIFTEERRWVFEYTKENILWYNYSLFHSVFNFVSLDVTENTKYITDWFTKNILGKPILTSGNKFVWDEGVVNIIENSIKETEGVVGSNIPIVERVLENGVKNTWTSGDNFEDVEDTIQNGVKQTLSESIADSFAIEDTIQNGVKHTEYGDWLDGDERIGDITQNGVKQIYDDFSDNQARVDGIIKIGKKL
jgi:hypothetical protein